MPPLVDSRGALALADLERAARAALDAASWAYLAGGAGRERTLRANEAAFDEVTLAPRIFRAAGSEPRTAVTVLGSAMSMPVFLAPTSPQRLFHSDAELATARAAARHGVTTIVSSDSHFSFREVMQAGSSCWFQIYAYRSTATARAMIAMAEDAGAEALVLTVDADHEARRLRAQRAGFRCPDHVRFGTLLDLHLEADVGATARLPRLPLSWSDFEQLRCTTRLPLVVKGVLDPEDARRCRAAGADGIIVSNHGGRQFDGCPPTLHALSTICAAIDDDWPIMVDGGVRSGIDVVKALAVGASAVGIGRPYLWGLAAGGEEGVFHALSILRAELEDALRQLGLADVNLADCDPRRVRAPREAAPA